MLYADGAFKLAHVEGPNGLTCLPILANARAHQVRLKEAPLSRKGKGRCQVRKASADSREEAWQGRGPGRAARLAGMWCNGRARAPSVSSSSWEMPRHLHRFCASNLHTCPQSCTVGHAFPGKAVPHLASWNGMVERKAPRPSWNDAERQSARRGRRLTCRLSHVRESKEQHGFRSSKTSPLVPTFIVSPPVYSHTAFLDDFFSR